MLHSPLLAKRVVVVGAGLAGLAFVVSLASMWPDEGSKEGFEPFPEITIYEREDHYDSTKDASRAGYSLSIRSGSSSPGVQALQEMGLLDTLLDVGITRESCEKGYFGLWSRNWQRLVRKRKRVKQGLPVQCMRIKRTELRRALLKAAAKHAKIEWGVTCTELTAATRPGDKTRLHLSNGQEDLCDFVVVADGANSKLHSSVEPSSCRGSRFKGDGIVLINGVASFPGGPPDPIARDWGIIPSGHGVALFASPMDRNCANWSLSYRTKRPRAEQRQPMSAGAAKALLLEASELGACFHERFRTLLDHTDLETLSVMNARDRIPFPHGSHNNVPDGVVFIGDSNHAVTPFAGNGANMALRDGFDLAKCLCSNNTVQGALAAYDALSMPRAKRSVRRSATTIAVVHSTGLTWWFYRSLILIFAGLMELWYQSHDAMRSFGPVSPPGSSGQV